MIFFIVDGGDKVSGGEGTDIVLMSHLASQYTIEGDTLKLWSGKEVDLDGVEYIGFGYLLDTPFSVNVRLEDLVDPDGEQGAQASLAEDQLNKLSDLYIAYFGRAPDSEGLLYWFKEVYTDVLSFDQVAQSFSQQVEYKNAYPSGASNDGFITTIYQNMFNRAPDQAGFDYWKNELDGGMARDSFMLTVINGVYAATGSADDRALLSNKHDVSRYYAEQSSLNPGEGFDNSINALLSQVSSNAETIETAKEIINHAFEDDILTLTGIVNDQELWATYWQL